MATFFSRSFSPVFSVNWRNIVIDQTDKKDNSGKGGLCRSSPSHKIGLNDHKNDHHFFFLSQTQGGRNAEENKTLLSIKKRLNSILMEPKIRNYGAPHSQPRGPPWGPPPSKNFMSYTRRKLDQTHWEKSQLDFQWHTFDRRS